MSVAARIGNTELFGLYLCGCSIKYDYNNMPKSLSWLPNHESIHIDNKQYDESYLSEISPHITDPIKTPAAYSEIARGPL